MSTFTDRRQALFDCLSDAESQVLNKPCNQFKIPDSYVNVRSINSRKMRHETKHFKGKNSLFTRPAAPIDKCLSKMSNFQRNLNNWTYYNMEDVPDVTESTNAAAAAACRQEIDVAKITDSMDDDSLPLPLKIAFKLPIKTHTSEHCVVEDSSSLENKEKIFINSKIVLPEYVVGMKKSNKPAKKVSKDTESKRSQLKLDHLLYEDDD